MIAPFLRRLSFALSLAAVAAFTATLAAQIPSRNVNMVSGLEWPGGDPFLQRQNEPSVAASTRNPLHLLAGANDYRSVDLPGLGDAEEIGDAWLGLFKSVDGGERWNSTLLPGYPQDPSPSGLASPLHSYQAAADPVVRAGTNGLIYYAGLVFDRTPDVANPGKSAIFVSRFIDNNNQEAGDSFRYIGTKLVSSSVGGATKQFLDKPWVAVDIPRQGGATCRITTTAENGPFTQRIPAGMVYVAYTLKGADAQGDRWDLYFSRSADCGDTFSAPIRISKPEDRVNQGAQIVISPPNGDVFIAWRRLDINAADGIEDHAIIVAKSNDQGKKFNPPGIARRFPRGKKKGLDPWRFSQNGRPKSGAMTATVIDPDLAPFDQGTSAYDLAFRSNAYPTITADGTGRLYMAWTERGFATEPTRTSAVDGDARIMLSTSTNGQSWSTPQVVADLGQKGHQIMPSLSFAGGKLMLAYYDLQEDRSQVFTKYVDDRTSFNQTSPDRRHTIDLRVSMGSPGAAPSFAPSVPVSQYLRGARTSSGPLEQLQVNAPNLPMFKLGTVPFIGDYIDIAPSPSFVPTAGGGWAFNTTASSAPPEFHVAWADNRDVRPPADRNWQNYTPPNYTGLLRPGGGGENIICLAGQAGARNQNIYTARVSGGLVVGSPGNAKPLSQTLQRSFVVFAQNTTDTRKYFRMTILNQPQGGRASFDQFPLPPYTPSSPAPLAIIDVTTPPYSTASRTVYVTSSDAHAPVMVDVSEISAVGAPGEIAGGLEGTIRLNADVLNPEVDNPEVDNPEVDNPEVDNAEVFNPEVDNPEVDNPEVDNPEVDNPEVDNPEVDNIVVVNPEVDNPEVDNPEVDNPEVDNPEVDNPEVDNATLLAGGGIITDVTWQISNTGNTTAAYDINVFLRGATIPTGSTVQLLIYKIYKTPVIRSDSCDVKTITQNVLLANIVNPELIFSTGDVNNPNDPDATNATLWLAPMEEARVTLRIFDEDKSDNIIVGGASIDPQWVPEQDVSLFAQSHAVNSPDAPTISEPPLVGADPVTTLLVTNTADSGPGSLRDAMTLANLRPGPDVIFFNIPGATPHVISPASALPTITDPVQIDGSTQPGYVGVPVIEIEGSGAGGGSNGLHLSSGGSLIRALAINRFNGAGMSIDGAGLNIVYANYIGTDTTGMIDRGNGGGGIFISGVSTGNLIGSGTAADRNVISGNAFNGVLINGVPGNNTIQGNYIGVNALGTAALGNGANGVFVSGGAGSAVIGNVISGNINGIHFRGNGNTALGNKIGTNALGTAAIPNLSAGVMVSDSVNNIIGGSTAFETNQISGNNGPGVLIDNLIVNPSGTFVQGNLIGTDPTGTVAIPNLNGVYIRGASNVIIGFPGAARQVISGNSADGIVMVASGGGALPSGNLVSANYIGTDISGTLDLGNAGAGVSMVDASSVHIGDSGVVGRGNLISGNNLGGIRIAASTNAATANMIYGNFIGTDVTGNAALPNTGRDGIQLVGIGHSVDGTIIGGALVGEPNVIGGNSLNGIALNGVVSLVTNTTIAGNRIGVGLNGTVDLGNGQSGVNVSNATTTVIGGAGGDRNIISGNGIYGVQATNAANLTIQNNYIGTTAAGTAALPNAAGGMSLTGAQTTGALIGGVGLGNVISGNAGFAGIGLQDMPASVISYNFIGTNAAGTAALGNNNNGIDVDNGGAVVIDSNVVSGNTANGIYVVASNNATMTANIVGLDSSGNAAVPNNTGIFAEFLSNAVIGSSGNGNTVSGNSVIGIRINSASNMQVRGNRVGTDTTGMIARANGSLGILVNGATSSGTIGGDTPATRNVVSGNTLGFGVTIVDGTNLFVEGNYIGVNAAGNAALGNSIGVAINGGTNIGVGDTPPGQYNVISGNDVGVMVSGSTGNNRLDTNFIGTDSTGLIAIPNTSLGVGVQGGSTNFLITGNKIAFNGGAGVGIANLSSGISIASSIFGNAGLGIDLGFDGVTANDFQDADAGPNGQQNYPTMLDATTTNVFGTLNSTPNKFFNIRLYVSPSCDPSGFGEGGLPIASVFASTDANGDGVFSRNGLTLTAGQFVTATATMTGPGGSTSEFSQCQIVGAGSPLTTTVTNTNNSGVGSLRYAIQLTNLNENFTNTINFNLPGPGPYSIVPTTELPQATQSLMVDGWTQPGYAGQPIVELDGSATPSGSGLTFLVGGSTARGLVVNRFKDAGLMFRGTGGGNVVEGNYIGTDLTGTLDRGNDGNGIEMHDGSSNRIGGALPAQRNIVSGNGVSNVSGAGITVFDGNGHLIAGNYIGTNAFGTAAIPNENNGITFYGTDSSIGGPFFRNVISGNGTGGAPSYAAGVTLLGGATNNRVFGNFIGTDVTGTVALPNSGMGVALSGVTGNFIGGSGSGEGNVISGNGTGPAFGTGIFSIGGTSNVILGNLIGTDVTGTAALGNLLGGIRFIGGGSNNTFGGNAPGEANTIAFNGGPGIAFSFGTGNAVRGGGIKGNAGLAIDLNDDGPTANDPLDADGGANNGQNYPVVSGVLTTTTTVGGEIFSAPSTVLTIEFFNSSTATDAVNSIATVTVVTDLAGHAFIPMQAVSISSGTFVTALATDAAGNTSELSAGVIVP